MSEWRLDEGGWTLAVLLLVTAILILAADPARGEPVSPANLTVIESSRGPTSPSASAEALAGNVTEIQISANTITKSWAGYFGNVSGTIVLDDAYNNTLYMWTLDEPSGEVYAARDPVDFSGGNVVCANASNIDDEETNLSIGNTDKDGVNETFSLATHPAFYVGSSLIPQDECNYTLSTYVNDAADPDRAFNETLLFDVTNEQIVYTALISNNREGFKVGAESYDFQMLVGEDGHSNTDTTRYYFYVELE